ncbi:MAG: signal peptidase II, partial [Pseudomonadota bacterium]|nr:signal peptidase II [Pseudomonadota bacterium]
MLLGLGIAVLVLLADQLSKLYVAGYLLNGRGVIMVGDYFNIVTAWNTGVSFSMFNNWGIWGTICLSLIAVSIVAYLLYWLTKEKKPLIQVSLG